MVGLTEKSKIDKKHIGHFDYNKMCMEVNRKMSFSRKKEKKGNLSLPNPPCFPKIRACWAAEEGEKEANTWP